MAHPPVRRPWLGSPEDFRNVRWVFLRLLALIYGAAFLSLWSQAEGLIGPEGILLAGAYLREAKAQLGAAAYYELPTLGWFFPDDAGLRYLLPGGVVLSVLLLLNVAPMACLAGLWAAYLSLTVVGQDFLAFQWDALLLEAGFLAIWVAPRHWWPKPSWLETPPSAPVVWLFRWLLLRLMFLSGAAKLLSGDPSWRDLTALTVHYQTQPLPTWIGWYAHHLPPWVHHGCCVALFVIELAGPWLILCGRAARGFCAFGFVLLMALIGATGNYAFFDFLTAALCVWLLDDQQLAGLFRLHAAGAPKEVQARRETGAAVVVRTGGVAILALAVGILSLGPFLWKLLGVGPPLTSEFTRLAAPFRSVNNYGLFAVMTTHRQEIVVEGSNDGTTWQAYEFRWKPGDLKREPAFVEPHQPRLDWQMWFAALNRSDREPWFVNFMVCLLQGKPAVTSLLASNPFPDKPPRYVRAELYEYRFTTPAEREATGAWWVREPQGPYSPPLHLTGNGPVRGL